VALGGETRAQRSAAEKRLIELGPKVLPLLPAPELLATNSVREAVRKIRIELERVLARESVLPSHVTLHGMRSLSDILAEIARQTGNRLDGLGLGEEALRETMDLDVEAIPFWQVLDDLAARRALHYVYDANLRGLRLLAGRRTGRPAETAASYPGAFRFTALPAVRKTTPRGVTLARVTLRLMSEPRLRPLFLQFAMKDVSARTKDQGELQAFNPEASYELALSEGGGQSEITLDYLLPEISADLLSLKGKLQCTTAAGNEPIRFTDLARAQEARGENVARRRGGVTVTLNRVQGEQASAGKIKANILVGVAYDTGGPAFESHRTWILHNEVYLEDRSGGRLRLNGGSETTQQGNGSVGIEYHFVDLPHPIGEYSFVYVAPTLIVDVPIEFEIQSVPFGGK
jgi:hypothetical protein